VTAREPRHTDMSVMREKAMRLKGSGKKERRNLVHDRGRRLQPHDFHEEIFPMSCNNFLPRYCLFEQRRVSGTITSRWKHRCLYGTRAIVNIRIRCTYANVSRCKNYIFYWFSFVGSRIIEKFLPFACPLN